MFTFQSVKRDFFKFTKSSTAHPVYAHPVKDPFLLIKSEIYKCHLYSGFLAIL